MKGMSLLKKELSLSGWIGFTISFFFLQIYNLYLYNGHLLQLVVFALLLVILTVLIARISSRLLKQKDRRISKSYLVYTIIIVTVIVIGVDIAFLLI